MPRRIHGWLLATLLSLPLAIKVIGFLEDLFPHKMGHRVRLELPDEGQHGYMPTIGPPSPPEQQPPFLDNEWLDAANQAAIMRATLMRGHPAYLGFAAQPPVHA